MYVCSQPDPSILVYICLFSLHWQALTARVLNICAIYVSAYYYICVSLQYVSSYCYMCPHTALCVFSVCVLILLYMCPHTTLYASFQYVSSYWYKCVLILLYMCLFSICPHTAIYVSSYYFICVFSVCVLILPYMCPICVLILIYVSFQFVSSYGYMCPPTSIRVSSVCVLLVCMRRQALLVYEAFSSPLATSA